MQIIILFGIGVILVNACYIAYILDNRNQQEECYIATSGDYKGQTHTIKDWRRIAIELAKTTKNSKLNAMAKYGTDEDIIGLLYINFGVDLVDYEEN